MLDLHFPAAQILTLTKRLEMAGGDSAAALAGAGLEGRSFQSPLEPLPIRHFVELDAYCREWSGDPLFSVNAAMHSTGEEFEWAAFALHSQPNVRQMLRVSVENWDKAVSPVRVVMEENGHGADIHIQPRQPTTPSLEIYLEFQLALLMVVCHRGVEGPLPPDRLHLEHAARTHQTAYHDAYGVKPAFDAGRYALGYSQSKLDTPLKNPDRKLAEVAYKTWMREAERYAPESDNTAMATLKVLRGADLPEKWHLEGMAALLHMPPRTLQYRLRQCGTTFQALVDSARKELAANLLERGLTQSDIAQRLGFADEGSLRKAYRRWHGRPPRAGVTED